ncbi:involucrin-like [Impatiens glandulifera]|uniref:involucrin-like n=1 Tax=Impatiens glandulifera TaxID=253017 RepID=UPI001FB0E674|nr:involucrin-like [Impatiens glandulifera]
MNSWLNQHFFFLLLNLMIGTIAFTSTFNNRHHHQQQQQQQQQQKPNHREEEAHNRNQEEEEEILIQQQSSSTIPTPTPLPLPPTPTTTTQISSIHHHNYQNGSKESDPPSSIQTQVDSLQDSGTHLPQTPTVLDPQETNFKEEEEEEEGEAPLTLDDVYVQTMMVNKLIRTTAEPMKESSEIPVRKEGRMKKSVSMKAEAKKKELELEETIEARRPATMREGKGKKTTVEKDEYGVDEKADDFINRFKQQLMLQRMDSIGRQREIRVKK